MLLYATEADLSAWMGTVAPANAAALLRAASGLVRSYTRLARYATDPAGYPTDGPVAAAYRDATTAQAQYWADLGIDPTKGVAGIQPAAKSKSIGSASVTYEDGGTAAKAQALTWLAPEAESILDAAGLLRGQVQIQ